ncbi:MAG: hypothetical protein K5790_07880 [Nitrosopumilus sp.]|uniref:hypothetical protein n=1 Tax=Nitrosopumilus sp. TaxID=2024843 RepID=UPI00247EEC33|nr:hypothetical protein [Nitrosopumilus sp.]MCV0393186.1 hypothetical protein [Nitrosopumilus sp.]
MQKSGIILVVSGGLIVLGLALLVVGNQIILEGVNQGSGKISSSKEILISTELDSQKTSTGVFAVQVIEFKENTFSAKILDPFSIEIVSQKIDQDTIENEFEVFESGTYKLIIESADIEESQVFGAIGPVPDTGKKILGFLSIYVLIIGMGGLVVIAVIGIKNKKNQFK